MKAPKIAAIILNYNSEEDLIRCIQDLKAQKKVNLITIIIDNASNIQTVNYIKTWGEKNYPDAVSGSPKEILEAVKKNQITTETFFIYNNENKGYSAGNNIGIKIAEVLPIEAVLIANPDMRFPDKNYVSILYNTLISNVKYAVTSSKIIGLDNKNQNPLRETSFWEEFFWPLQLFPNVFKIPSQIVPHKPNKIIQVDKVMGCSVLLKMSFLRKIKYFDENVFLYSEEAILSKQVKKHNMVIIFTPETSAIHAHIRNKKGNSSNRMLEFIKSRKYYLNKYSGYNLLQKVLLSSSYALLSTYHKVKKE